MCVPDCTPLLSTAARFALAAPKSPRAKDLEADCASLCAQARSCCVCVLVFVPDCLSVLCVQRSDSPALHRVVKIPTAKDMKQASRRRRKSMDMMFANPTRSCKPQGGELVSGILVLLCICFTFILCFIVIFTVIIRSL